MSIAYDNALVALREQQAKNKKPHRITFITGVSGKDLWDFFINNIPAGEDVATYRCDGCRKNIVRYGNLVQINDEGRAESLMFPQMDAEGNPFKMLFNRMGELVESLFQTGTIRDRAVKRPVVYGKENDAGYGNHASGGYKHISITQDSRWTSKDRAGRKRALELGQAFDAFYRRAYFTLANIEKVEVAMRRDKNRVFFAP